MHGLTAGHGHNLQHKYQNPHSSYPVGKASPDQNAVGKILHPGQNTRSGSGKTGYNLEQGIGKAGDFSCKIKRQRSHQAHDNPAQCNPYISFSRIKLKVFRPFEGKCCPEDKGQQRTCQKNRPCPFPVKKRHCQRKGQKNPFHLKNPAKYISYTFVIHGTYAPSRQVYLLYHPILCEW